VNQGKEKHVVVLGAGFGGLTFCQSFDHPDARVTLVDRSNHHLFQPLLYQVATCGLAAADIAQPIRSILSQRERVTVLMDEVEGIDLKARRVRLRGETLDYDQLVLALGGVTGYFGHDEWERYAPGLKSLDDALRIRREVLLAFEAAESASDPDERGRLMTMIVVGGGPTGVELAGALAELSRMVLVDDFRRIDSSQARVILIEGAPRILGHLPEELSQSAERQLADLGVEILTGCLVKNVRRHEVEVERNGQLETIRAHNIIWAAGVSAVPVTRELGAELDRSGWY
jgi:NADH dehydrogenase